MNKNDLATQVAIIGCVTKTQAMATIDAIQSAIVSELKAGRDMTILGFAKFTTTTRKARAGRNPRTGEPITMPPRRMPSAKFSAVFKNTL